jgi:hypothetical protein
MVIIGLVRFDLDMVCFDHKKIKKTKWINMYFVFHRKIHGWKSKV